jgi:hypothetical protein
MIRTGCTYVVAAAMVLICVTSSMQRASAAEVQPLRAQVKRVAQVFEMLGTPLSPEQQAALDKAAEETEYAKAAAAIGQVLDPLCLANVHINPESRVKAQRGAAKAELAQHGWRVFLVKVENEAGVTAKLRCLSPNAEPLVFKSTASAEPKVTVKLSDVPERWMDLLTFDAQPFNEGLSGLPLEYRIVQIYSRDAGKREAKLMFDVGQGSQDLGFRNELNVLFNCAPAVEVKLRVLDEDGSPTVGQFVFRDAQGRVYPSRTRRLEPDFFFHDQVYRKDGESILLPPGTYDVAFGRGPEYRKQSRSITVGDKSSEETFRLTRWIHLADRGWYSGDHHIHAAGCAHYESPTQGVTPESMFRHVAGEDLNVGCVLSWGPCWYVQKNYFSGKIESLSTPKNLMRYDVEVSGFPSSHAGHLCLLRLSEDDYPGTTRIEQWPSWNLPVLQWGKSQGAVVGFSHSGLGLQVPGTNVPSYDMPKFDSIGANEFIVDVTHDAVDFISAVDTGLVWELSIWYHTLNCGFSTRISGETDFPCIYGERVGLGRSYVKLGKDQPLEYDAWVQGVKAGRSYVCDGLSHLVDFTVGGLGVGEKGEGGEASVLRVAKGKPLAIRVQAAALLEEKPREDIRSKGWDTRPYWHLERARLENTRQVRVELIANGKVVDSKVIEADGQVNNLSFEYTPAASTWVAARIMHSSHTNPVFVKVDDKPIRASRRSAKWCLDAVDVCWRSKMGAIRAEERAAAEKAYQHARQTYQRILNESSEE